MMTAAALLFSAHFAGVNVGVGIDEFCVDVDDVGVDGLEN